MEKHAEPIVRTAFLAQGFIVGGTVSLAYFTGDMAGNWAAFAGTGLGAMITVMGVAWLDARKGNTEQKRKQRAAIFPLGNALSEICKYSRRGMVYHVEIMENSENFSEEIPESVINAIKEVTEWFDGDEGVAAGAIGPKYQLCKARSEGAFSRHHDTVRIELVCDFAELHVLAGRLFDLSRGIDEPLKTGVITRKEIRNAFGISDNVIFPWSQSELVNAHLERRYKVTN